MAVGMSSFFGGGGLGKSGIFTPSSSGGGGTSTLTGSGALSAESAAEDAVTASGVKPPTNYIGPQESTKVSEIGTGAALGASIGSAVPVIGTGIGAVVGGLFGALGGMDLLGMGGASKGEIMRDRRKATQRSYAAIGGAYDYVTDKTVEINAQYETDLAAGRAKLAGQGIEVDGSPQWDALKGSLSTARSESLSALDTEMADFRKSGAFEWFENDYNYLTGIRRTSGGSAKNDAEWMKQEIGMDDHGRSNERLFTKDQYTKLLTNTDQSLSGLFEEYAKRLAPGVEAYEKAIFGTAEDKAAFKTDMDARIDEANKWYTREIQAKEVADYNRNAAMGSGK